LCFCRITEDKARFEQKYQSAEVLPSFHNFVVLSNTKKAVEIPNSERRFFMLCCTDLRYSQEKLDSLWALVKDPSVQELFFHYLLGVDSSIVKKGQAPFTAFKQQIQSAQAPNAIKWIKHLLTDTDAMCTCPGEVRLDSERYAITREIEESGLFRLRHRPAAGNDAFSNLVGEEWEQHALQMDLAKRSAVKTVVPIRHVTDCVMNYFKGQSFRGTTEDDIVDSFKSLGLKVDLVKKIPSGGTSRRCIVFPSVQGLMFLLKKKRWVSGEEVISYDDEE